MNAYSPEAVAAAALAAMQQIRREGSIRAILGPSRSGKSARLFQIANTLSHTSSRVFYAIPNLLHASSSSALEAVAAFDPGIAAAAAVSSTVDDDGNGAKHQLSPTSVFQPFSECRPHVNFINTIEELYTLASAIEFLLVDDAHFIPDFSGGALCLAAQGVNIVFSGSNSTTEGNPWPSLAKAIALSNEFEHMQVACANCLASMACFSYHIVGAIKADYQPLCRGCYRQMRALESPIITPVGSPQRKTSNPMQPR